MKKLTKVLVIAMALLATVGAGVAVASFDKGHASASNGQVSARVASFDKGQAAARMVRLAHWKAACGQGYWRCQGFVIQGPYGPGVHDPEWTGTVILFRHRKKSQSWQTCHIEVALNHDESTEELLIDCEYALTAPDRPHAASWS